MDDRRLVDITPMTKQPSIFSSPVVARLAAELEAGFENPERIVGTCQFDIVDELGSTAILSVCFDDKNLLISNIPLEHCDAKIHMSLAVATKIVENIEGVDYRDPDIIGAMVMTGNLNLVNHLAKALVKPSKMTQHTLDDASNVYRDAYAVEEVVYLDNPTEMEILETLEAKQPFVIRNAPTHIPYNEWTLDKLKADYGEILLRVKSATEKETLAQFVDRLRQDPQNTTQIIEGHTKVYTEGCALPWQMEDDFLPYYFTTHDYTSPQIWLGSVPVEVPGSSLHRDPLDGFLYQIMGRKKVVLYSPDQASYLYPMKAYNNYQPCWVKPEKPNFEYFPNFQRARRVNVILHLGEILVQPAGWFHAVYCLDSPTFSVSYFLNFPVGVNYHQSA